MIEESEIPKEQEITPVKRTNKLLIFSAVFLGLCIVLLIFFIQKLFGTTPTSTQVLEEEQPSLTEDQTALVTPMPFHEMTVPYLRERTYESRLSDREIAYQGSNYTAYLTSYESDGFKVNGLLTVPDGDTPRGGYPAIVFIHGYIPPTQYQTTQQYRDYVDYLARNGFVVFKIDLRGHGSSEGEAGGGYYGSDYIVDTLNAYSALAHADFVNPELIGLWGHSMAGNVVLRSMVSKPTIKAAAVWGGAVFTYEDWDTYGIDDNSYRPPDTSSDRQQRRQLLFDEHGRYSADSEFWQQVSPKAYLNDIQGAISLHHAVNDPVVNIGYSRDLTTLLDDTDVVHELHEYSGGGHNISPPYFTEAMADTTEFFKEYLQ